MRNKSKRNRDKLADKIIKYTFKKKNKKVITSLKEQVIFGIIIASKMKVMVIKIETYHFKKLNVLTKWKLTWETKNLQKLKKETEERYQSLSEEGKNKKRQYHRDQNKTLSEEDKQKRNYYLAHKK